MISKPIFEFVGLRAKMYYVLTPEKKTAKGVSNVVIQLKLKHSNYLQRLKENKRIKENMISIKSEYHDIYIVSQNKTALSSFEDKSALRVEWLRLTVWCALWAPYFFKNDEGHNVTLNGDRYRAMITNFFILELNNHDVQELWFRQDGAKCHTARATIDLLRDTFSDRLISRFGPVNWPPRPCDLTPLDYFLWGYEKVIGLCG
ncbi:uncharacterized protein TNCV_581091 [Trichonephila clavipes]|nr:uncharacterized protein TNCV_581091 [Trichonephila clavipes]